LDRGVDRATADDEEADDDEEEADDDEEAAGDAGGLADVPSLPPAV
jgi:hypothetical protein